MIQKLSAACAKNIISLGQLQEINEAVLRYGCELILTSVVGLVILISLSFLIGHPFAWLFFLISFVPHRTSAGGYHADTHTRCYIITSAMFLLGTMAAYGLEWNRYTYPVVSLLSGILIFSLAPLEAKNKPLSAARFRSNRIRSLIVASTNIIISVIISVLNLVSEEVNMYFAGIFFAASSLIMGKIKYTLKGGNCNES